MYAYAYTYYCRLELWFGWQVVKPLKDSQTNLGKGLLSGGAAVVYLNSKKCSQHR